jgi:hypothetical protein
MEQAEKFELLDKQVKSNKTAPYSYSSSMIIEAGETHKQHISEQTDHYPLMVKAVDVFGKEVEPICDYFRCHHKLSLHGLSSGKCRCKHPRNATIGA